MARRCRVVTASLVMGVGRGAMLGLGVAVPIGQVNVEVARRSLRGGFWRGFAVGAGASAVDVTYAVLSTLGVGAVLSRPGVATVMSFTAVVVLTYLGVQCLRAGLGRRPGVVGGGPTPGHELTGPAGLGFLTGVAMNLTNPMVVVFWFATVPGVAWASSRADLWPIAGGVFVGTVAWVTAFAGTLSVLRRFDRGSWLRTADLAGGTILLGFAGLTFLRSIRGVL